MSYPKDLARPYDDLPNIRHQGWLHKRSGSFPHSFRKRYCVVACNFLFLYTDTSDDKPHKAIWIESVHTEGVDPRKKHEFCFTVKTDNFEGIFAAETEAEKQEWMRHIRAAPYGQVYSRSMAAVRFLERASKVLNLQEDEESKSAENATQHQRKPSGNEMIEAIQALKEERDQLKTSNEALQEEAGQLDIDPNDENAQLQRLRSELHRSREESRRYKQQNEDLSEQLSNAERQIKELKDDLDASNQSAVAMARAAASSGNRAPQNEELVAVRSQLQAAQRTAGMHEEKIKYLQAEVSRLKTELEAAEEAKRAVEKSSFTSKNGFAEQPRSAKKEPDDQKLNTPLTAEQRKTDQHTSPNSDPHEHEWMPFYREAQSLERNGRYADAEQQYQVVYDVRAEHHGQNSILVASVCRDLGRVLALQEKFDQAEVQYLKAVKLCSELQGEGHPNTACALTDLAAVLREQDKLADAEKYASRAVDSLREGVGAKDVSTATALYNLAGLAKRQGKFDDAARSYSEALQIFREKLGNGQAETADTLYQMGCLYRKTGDYLKAGRYFGEAADAYTATYGQNDKRVAESTRRQRAMAEKMANSGTRRPRNRRVSGYGNDKK
eukprot:gb/GECG01013444.1/.p1 GENE.gb/GECG01013444.1/~~gb/GECG01013444.1/.p1  ORF type:complete len:610 (+),score=106.08 gb/GECG01013444.1/:1-1830(+)